MKKLIALLSLAVALVALAFAAAPAPVINDARTPFSRTTDEDGITTSVYIGRITSDPQPSGEFPVVVHFAVIKTTASGRIISNEQISREESPLTFPLPSQAASGIVALAKAAYEARKAPPPAPAPEAETPPNP
jgi:hypothetical protein